MGGDLCMAAIAAAAVVVGGGGGWWCRRRDSYRNMDSIETNVRANTLAGVGVSVKVVVEPRQ
jgi:hypothetical protein